MEKKEFYCPSCKKIVKDVRSELAAKMVPTTNMVFSGLPGFVCRECESPVMEVTKNRKKA